MITISFAKPSINLYADIGYVLHQTTTPCADIVDNAGCILFYFYIKPQRRLFYHLIYSVLCCMCYIKSCVIIARRSIFDAIFAF